MNAHLLLIALAACGGHQRKLETARSSRYDGTFEQVFQTVTTVVQENAPNVETRPPERVIKTAWREVDSDTPADEGAREQPRKLSRPRGSRVPTRNFVRFDVVVTGGPPWQVQVAGFASTWAPDAARPMQIPQSQRPGWLETHTNALVLAIHRRLRACCARAAP